MAYGPIILKLGDTELAQVGCDLPEGLEATVERDGQSLTVVLAVPEPKAKKARK